MSPDPPAALKASPRSGTRTKVILATADQAAKAAVISAANPAGMNDASELQTPPPSALQSTPLPIRLQVTVAPVPKTGLPHLPGVVEPRTKSPDSNVDAETEPAPRAKSIAAPNRAFLNDMCNSFLNSRNSAAAGYQILSLTFLAPFQN